MKIGKTLKKIREETKCSKTFIAKKLNISRRQYDRIEKDEISISLDELTILLKFYKINMIDFFSQNQNEIENIEDKISGLLSMIKNELFISKEFIEEYDMLLESIDTEKGKMSELSLIKLDLIDTFYTIKQTNNLAVIQKLYDKYKNNMLAQESVEYLNLIIPLLSYEELVELARVRINSKVLNTQGYSNDNINILLNIMSQIIDQKEVTGDETLILDEIKNYLAEDKLLLKIVIYFRNKASFFKQQNINEDRVLMYETALKILMEEFNLSDIQEQIRKETD